MSETTAARLGRSRKTRQSTTGENYMAADGSITAAANVTGTDANYATTDTVASAAARTTAAGTYKWWANYLNDR